ncbi:MAG: isoleucine--tRNA ligase, partial [Thermoanaerobaculia bacterium]
MTDDSPRFPPLPAGYPFPALEEEVLEQWRRERTFAKTLEKTRDGEPFVFYEGPPTANNKPHVGHVMTRVVKDLFPRFQTMRGRHVARKAGWDTHGLAVEIEVEKALEQEFQALGVSGKQGIEKYGVARFNAKCLESVYTYERQWREMSERVGYWIDFDDAYFTYHNRYIESAWWALKRLWETKDRWGERLLYEDYKIQPYCARCGTTLSSHEVAQNYQEVDDPSIWVLFPVRRDQTVRTTEGKDWTTPEGLAIVAWTTTPWTVLANVALAVNPSLTYKVVEHPGEPERLLLFAEEGLEQPVPLVVERDDKREQLDLRHLEPVVRISGRDLGDLWYQRPFPLPILEWMGPSEAEPPDDRQVFAGDDLVAGDFVTAAEGTGIVHIATYGEDDDRVIRTLPDRARVFSVGDDGKIVDEEETRRAGLAGRWFKEADPDIARELRRRGLLLHQDRHRHNYPFCWRCDRPLLYFPARSWFIRTTALRDELLTANRRISWHPDHVGEGRFGRWIEGGVDWALSRRRYWGTPLPIWRCLACPADPVVVGSFAELFRRAGKPLPDDVYDRERFDPHRPFVDTHQVGTSTGLTADELEAMPLNQRPFAWRCEKCSGIVVRVNDVIDAWFDSGAMPFAQHHYPFENEDLFSPPATQGSGVRGQRSGAESALTPDPSPLTPGRAGERGFPADFISEAVDQTRGWFYTLHALGVLLFDSEAYRNCIVMGHINDEQGRKMSKRLGNVVDPMEVIPETGADAMRWYFYVNNPELTSRFSARLVREAAQRFLIPIWNAVSFFTIYANLDGWTPAHPPRTVTPDPSPLTPRWEGERPALDRWVLARLDTTVREVTAALEGYEIAPAARALEAFIDDLTNWYVRRSRDRFWTGAREKAAEKESAYQALYETLTTLARLLAPFTPFLAEVLHRHLVRSQPTDAPASVHLEDWPEPRDTAVEPELLTAMADVQRVVRLGRAARSTHELKTRQPLAAVTLVASDAELRARVEPYLDILRDELNVHRVEWAARRTDYVHHEVRPVFPKLGPRFGKRMPALKAVLEAADGDRLAAQLESEGRLGVELDGETVELSADEVAVRLIEHEGLATAGDSDLLVALDTALTDELIAEGWAREVVHRIQTARKEADLDYAARIRVRFRADDALAAAIAA